MCNGETHDEPAGKQVFQYPDTKDIAPAYSEVVLPDPALLSRLVDAHCHPTDLDFEDEDFNDVGLGGLCAMATRTDDQDKVERMAERWAGQPVEKHHANVIACFGHHPWFSHYFTLQSPLPSKEAHYASLWLPEPNHSSYTSHRTLLDGLIPHLPDPLPFSDALVKLREQISRAQKCGQAVMLGELGVDKVARVAWPVTAVDPIEGWEKKRLTPFKTRVSHQREMVLLQLELALELGVHVSLHGVGAAAAVIDILDTMRKRHGPRFVQRMKIDLHSSAGLYPDSLRDIQKKLPNIYISPSLALNATNAKGAPLIRIADPDRLLVESDTHDIRQCTKRVWGAVVWIARIKGWTEEQAVEIIEANWARFMST